MSILLEIIQEQYPHFVEIKSLDIDRRVVSRWCTDNGILEFDVSPLYDGGRKIGIVMRFVHMDDWLIAKLKWA